jgi:hypothetical protein
VQPENAATAITTRTMSIAETTLSSLAPAAFQTESVAPQPAASAIDPLAPLQVVTNVLSTLMSWVGLSPAMSGMPATPLQSPILWTLFAFARREMDPSSLTLAPVSGSQELTSLTIDPSTSFADTGLPLGPNLLVNPGAEVGDPSLSGYSSVTVPGWVVTGTPTVIEYGTQRRFPFPLAMPGPTFPSFLAFPSTRVAPPDSGAQFFGGGPVATSTLTQYVDVSAAATEIDSGGVPFALSGDLGGFFIDPSAASVSVAFLDANGAILDTGTIGPVTGLDRLFSTGFEHRATTGTVPVGTRRAVVVVSLTDHNPVLGNYNNAYADNLSLRIGASLPAPPPPAPPVSKVGALDHVFMVYMENKGYTQIVGSPNAPYLNSLIDTYGLETNYYGLTHPSDPNYTPIIGGSDFGFNWNCPSNCFDAPTLVDNVEAAGLTWAGYQQGGGGYSEPTDRLPFLAFSDIYNDPARVESHIFDISQMGVDLQNPATAPNFAWFAADDATNMEGPTDFPIGWLRWFVGLIDPRHQYNVAAGDEWLSEQVPVIMNSNTWQDPTQKSAIFITFDEDYNNISLGIGNQGNHIVMVVIPSPGAVNAGMRSGNFTVDDYANHYSLLRTIEDALGLPPLTNNDRYASPMNGYWV